MESFTIYNDTLIYMALYLKRESVQDASITINQQEMSDYLNLVRRSLERGKQYSSYIYRFAPGAPNYRIDRCTPETRNKLVATTYAYDNRLGTYTTIADAEGLALKSINLLPMTIRPHFYPVGWEKALNVFPRRGFTSNGKVAVGEEEEDIPPTQPGD